MDNLLNGLRTSIAVREAQRMMKVASELPNVTMRSHLEREISTSSSQLFQKRKTGADPAIEGGDSPST